MMREAAAAARHPSMMHHEQAADWLRQETAGHNTLLPSGVSALYNVVRSRWSWRIGQRNAAAYKSLVGRRAVLFHYDPVRIQAAYDRRIPLDLARFEEDLLLAFFDSLSAENRERLLGLAVVGCSRQLETWAYSRRGMSLERTHRGLAIVDREQLPPPGPVERWLALAAVWKDEVPAEYTAGSCWYHQSSATQVLMRWSAPNSEKSFVEVGRTPLAPAAGYVFDFGHQPPAFDDLLAGQQTDENGQIYIRLHQPLTEDLRAEYEDCARAAQGCPLSFDFEALQAGWRCIISGMPFVVPCVRDSLPAFGWIMPTLTMSRNDGQFSASGAVRWLGYDNEVYGHGLWMPMAMKEDAQPEPSLIEGERIDVFRTFCGAQPTPPPTQLLQEASKGLGDLQAFNVTPAASSTITLHKLLMKTPASLCLKLGFIEQRMQKPWRKAKEAAERAEQATWKRMVDVYQAAMPAIAQAISEFRFADERRSVKFGGMQQANVEIVPEDRKAGRAPSLLLHSPLRNIQVQMEGMGDLGLICGRVCTTLQEGQVITDLRIVMQFMDDRNGKQHTCDMIRGQEADDYGLEVDGEHLDRVLDASYCVCDPQQEDVAKQVADAHIRAFYEVCGWLDGNSRPLVPKPAVPPPVDGEQQPDAQQPPCAEIVDIEPKPGSPLPMPDAQPQVLDEQQALDEQQDDGPA